MLTIIYIGGGLALLLLIIGVVITLTSEQSMVEERLGRYLQEEDVNVGQKRKRSSPVADWANTRLEKSNWGGGLSRELARADLKLKPAEYIALMLIAAI